MSSCEEYIGAVVVAVSCSTRDDDEVRRLPLRPVGGQAGRCYSFGNLRRPCSQVFVTSQTWSPLYSTTSASVFTFATVAKHFGQMVSMDPSLFRLCGKKGVGRSTGEPLSQIASSVVPMWTIRTLQNLLVNFLLFPRRTDDY